MTPCPQTLFLRAALLAALLSVLPWAAPPAAACNPYVAGNVVCSSGGPAGGVAVEIHTEGSFFCGPATFQTTTSSNGEFSLCTGCEGWTTVTVKNESRSRDVQTFTDFGTWTISCGCRKCPDVEQDPGDGQ